MKAKFLFLMMVLSAASASAQTQVVMHGEGSSTALAKEIVKNSGIDGWAHIMVVFDDGEVLEVNASRREAQAYIDKTIAEDVFLDRISAKPATRGPVLLKADCDPPKGMACGKNPECDCAEGQYCKVGDSKADPKGCVEEGVPENALLLGKSYACKPGYEWDGAQTGCAPRTECPVGQTPLEGRCYGQEGKTDDGGLWCLMGFGLLSLPIMALVAVIMGAGALILVQARRKK
ncbi:MAG: hypothetical protein V1875_04890 [Candidatus Altiarchaeota archaeon]